MSNKNVYKLFHNLETAKVYGFIFLTLIIIMCVSRLLFYVFDK